MSASTIARTGVTLTNHTGTPAAPNGDGTLLNIRRSLMEKTDYQGGVMKILKSFLVFLLSVFLAVNPALNELLWALDFPLNTAKTYALSAQKEASTSPSAFVTSQAAVKVPSASSLITQAAEKTQTSSSSASSALEAREKVLNDYRSQNAFMNRRASAALRQDSAVVSAFDVTAEQKFDTQDTQAIATSIKEKKEYNQAMDLNTAPAQRRHQAVAAYVEISRRR